MFVFVFCVFVICFSDAGWVFFYLFRNRCISIRSHDLLRGRCLGFHETVAVLFVRSTSHRNVTNRSSAGDLRLCCMSSSAGPLLSLLLARPTDQSSLATKNLFGVLLWVIGELCSLLVGCLLGELILWLIDGLFGWLLHWSAVWLDDRLIEWFIYWLNDKLIS